MCRLAMCVGRGMLQLSARLFFVGGASNSVGGVMCVDRYAMLLTTAVQTVYLMGFIVMTPQLFINYKKKSVAALPWRMLFYRTLNTFIDDLFAFVIKMPTMHRCVAYDSGSD